MTATVTRLSAQFTGLIIALWSLAAPAETRRPQQVQLASAATILFLGVLVYLFDRPAAEIYFVPDWWLPADGVADLFGSLGRHLPTFAHVYAFILITVAIIGARSRIALVICAAWFMLEAAFEIAQLDAIATPIAAHVPAWFASVPLFDTVAGYFVNGRFDLLDLLSIALGALAAYATVQLSLNWAPKT